MLLQFPQRWHRGPVKTVPGCFSFPLTSFPHTDAASCVQATAVVGARVCFFSSVPPRPFSLFTVSSDEIWPTLH